ncbi:MAG: hypothetical protein ABIQ53_16085 [Terracoccus sp.]
MREALWWARSGRGNIMVAYPSVDVSALTALAGDETLTAAVTVMIDTVERVGLACARWWRPCGAPGRQGRRVKAIGAGHSFTGVAVTDGVGDIDEQSIAGATATGTHVPDSGCRVCRPGSWVCGSCSPTGRSCSARRRSSPTCSRLLGWASEPSAS